MKNKWLYQYLEGEKLHYLTEHHPEDGVLGEHFFESIKEFLDYTDEHNIKFEGDINAELYVTEVLNENLKLEYDKENGEGAFVTNQIKIQEELIHELKKLI